MSDLLRREFWGIVMMNAPLAKQLNLACTYRSSPTCLSESCAPQLPRRLLGVLCSLFSAVLVAVQIKDRVIRFLAGVDG